MTERSIELALADRWLATYPNTVEIGAVTPYYWPGRVGTVVDPGDSHPNVTDTCSLFDYDATRRTVLCVSTVEHVGTGEYGLPTLGQGPPEAIQHIMRADHYLITLPSGWNPLADVVFETPWLHARYLARVSGNTWHEVPYSAAKIAYTDRGLITCHANGLCIIADSWDWLSPNTRPY